MKTLTCDNCGESSDAFITEKDKSVFIGGFTMNIPIDTGETYLGGDPICNTSTSDICLICTDKILDAMPTLKKRSMG